MNEIEILSDEDEIIFVKETHTQYVDLTKKSSCSICLEELDASDFQILRSCKDMFCSDCITKHIINKIDQNQAISCPKCKKDIKFQDVKYLVPQKHLEIYDQQSLKKYLQNEKNFFECKSPDCNNGVIVQPEMNLEQWNCTKCNKNFCLKCSEESHPKMSCQEYQMWKLDSKTGEIGMSILLQEGKIKKCPNCGANSEKISG